MQASKLLRVFAVLFALLSVSNLLKPFKLSGEVGFVLLGTRLSGGANAIAGPLFGIYLAVYAIAVWRMKAYALPMGIAYAGYVIVNLIMWNLNMPPQTQSVLLFGLAYATIAVGVSSGSAMALWREREHLN